MHGREPTELLRLVVGQIQQCRKGLTPFTQHQVLPLFCSLPFSNSARTRPTSTIFLCRTTGPVAPTSAQRPVALSGDMRSHCLTGGRSGDRLRRHSSCGAAAIIHPTNQIRVRFIYARHIPQVCRVTPDVYVRQNGTVAAAAVCSMMTLQPSAPPTFSILLMKRCLQCWLGQTPKRIVMMCKQPPTFHGIGNFLAYFQNFIISTKLSLMCNIKAT